MALLEIILLVVLVIPLFAIFTDSPLGRAVARRLEGSHGPSAELGELTKRVALLESELEELSGLVGTLREEHRFLERLLEEGAGPKLPPPPAP